MMSNTKNTMFNRQFFYLIIINPLLAMFEYFKADIAGGGG